VVCWEAGDGWQELCEHLGLAIPQLAFLHANSSQNQVMDSFIMAENQRRVMSN
jgi:hypothetical protein